MESLRQAAEEYMRRTDFTEWDWQKLVRVFEPMFCQQGYRGEDSSGQQHILLIRLDAMGDMVLSTGFVREVRRNHPAAYITLLVSPAIYPLVQKCPYVNRILVLDKLLFHVDKRRFFVELMKLCAENFWSERYAVSICPQWGDDKTPSQLAAYLSGAKRRVGYSCNVERIYGFPAKNDCMETALMTDSYIIPAEIIHEAERTLYLLRLLGMTVADEHMEIWYSRSDVYKVEQLLQTGLETGRLLVAIGLGAGCGNRKYPVEKYAEALNVLAGRWESCFVLLGGEKEQADAECLQSLLPAGSTCNLVGRTTVLETAAALSFCGMYIGNDTGVMHMAAAAGLPVVMVSREAENFCDSLAGVLSENQRFAPWQTNYVICCPDEQIGACAKEFCYGGCKDKHSHCIKQVKPEDIVKAVEMLVQADGGV